MKGADVRDEGGKCRYKYHGDKRREATREMIVCLRRRRCSRRSQMIIIADMARRAIEFDKHTAV